MPIDMPESGGDPSVEECNDLLDWIEEHNDIDLNDLRLRIRPVDEPPTMYMVVCEWRLRRQHDRPGASEMLVKPGWIVEKWSWNGDAWITGVWRV